MTIRKQVQDEAQKAAIKIREAVEQFTQATGLEPEISIRFISRYEIDRSLSGERLIAVSVECGGVHAGA